METNYYYEDLSKYQQIWDITSRIDGISKNMLTRELRDLEKII